MFTISREHVFVHIAIFCMLLLPVASYYPRCWTLLTQHSFWRISLSNYRYKSSPTFASSSQRPNSGVSYKPAYNYGPCTHIQQAKHIWSTLVKTDSIVIDATCGNGHDSLYLARLLFGSNTMQSESRATNSQHIINETNTMAASRSSLLYCIDIQDIAIANTEQRLRKASAQYSALLDANRIQLFRQSHDSFPVDINPETVSLICYNLGYLPGVRAKENRNATTATGTATATATANSDRSAVSTLIEVTKADGSCTDSSIGKSSNSNCNNDYDGSSSGIGACSAVDDATYKDMNGTQDNNKHKERRDHADAVNHVTLPSTTIRSLQNAALLIKEGGAISVTAYTGHDGGAEENAVVAQFLSELDPDVWRVYANMPINRKQSPVLYTAFKIEKFGYVKLKKK